MSKYEKLLARIDNLDSSLTFAELERVLNKNGYIGQYPRTGSSHCTFRKRGCNPITIPNKKPIKKPYIANIRQVLKDGGILQ